VVLNWWVKTQKYVISKKKLYFTRHTLNFLGGGQHHSNKKRENKTIQTLTTVTTQPLQLSILLAKINVFIHNYVLIGVKLPLPI